MRKAMACSPPGFPVSIAKCIARAASAASAAFGNVHITSSPIVLISVPLCLAISCFMRFKVRVIIFSAASFPSCSYKAVLPQISANITAILRVICEE